MNISMLLFDNLTQLDLTAPFEVFSRMPDASIALVAATRDPVTSGGGLQIVPNATLADAPRCDLLFVPGGKGVDAAMLDARFIDFLREQAADANWITSVCTGSLLLGAAGLLRGYRATTHWSALDLLAAFGAEPVRDRVVRDRNRITGGGVTAGIDFALAVASELHGAELARSIAISIEYGAGPFPQPRSDDARREAVSRAAARLT